MKIKFLVLPILLAVFLSACGNDQYAIEKRYWKILRQAESIFKNPEVSPQLQVQKIVDRLNAFASANPKNNLAQSAEFTIAEIYLIKKEYPEARKQLNKLLEKYADSPEACARAVFTIGASYEREGKWGPALEQYKRVMEKYPMTVIGMQTPIYIAQYYKSKYQPDKMIVAYQEAAAHYKKFAASNMDNVQGYVLTQLAVQCYVETKEWQKAVDALNTLISGYKGQINLDEPLLTLAIIYDQQLKNAAKAKETLRQLIKDYPKGRLAKVAEEFLKNMDNK